MTRPTATQTRWPILGVIAFVSLTLLAAGQSEQQIGPGVRRFWVLAGQVGLISALGLFELNRRRAKASQQALELESRTDALTGLGNRRRLDEELQRRWHQWERQGTALSLLLIDLDHFKLVNDELGHLAGDKVLAEVGRVLTQEVRGMDLAARYGGEEFAVVLAGTEVEGAMQAAQRLHRRISESSPVASVGDGPGSESPPTADSGPQVTVSIGVAQFEPGDDSPQRVIERADSSLYSAKQAGRNRVSMQCHSESEIRAAAEPEDPAVPASAAITQIQSGGSN